MTEQKTKLFIDFDATITDSLYSYCEVYKYLYKEHKDYIEPKHYKIREYNLRDECPLVEDVNLMFEHPVFFNTLRFINGDTYDILEKLSKKYEIIICTIGTLGNVSLKALWLESNLPFIKNHIFINNGNNVANKSIIDMHGGIFIDDTASNLISSNADFKICFGEIFEWNKEWKGMRCFTWQATEKLLRRNDNVPQSNLRTGI